MHVISRVNKTQNRRLNTLENETLDRVNKFLKTLSKTQYLSALIETRQNLEMLEVSGDEICFRFFHAEVDALDLDGINRMILFELWRISNAVLSEENIDGKLTFKAYNFNKLRYSDVDILVEQITSIGEVLVKEYLPY